MNVKISESVLAEMESMGVTEEDVKEVVEYAESVQKLCDEESGRNLGRKRLEAVSVYAEYAISGDDAEVTRVYKHRVSLSEDL